LQLPALGILSAAYLPLATFPAETLVQSGTISAALTAVVAWCAASLRDGARRDNRLAAANRITLARIILVGPLAVLAFDGMWTATAVVYGIGLATDVLDGIIARRRREESLFGTLMDPVADIASTAVLYGAFWAHALVPGWVFGILMVRYGSLFVGSLALARWVGPLRFRATPVGKIVGVLQGAAAIMILVIARYRAQLIDTIVVTLFSFLGVIFVSVIVSQVIIGVRHLRSGGPRE
jgi:phosphatidylglycerophosphate synthase